jgi:hypothetical protein
VQTFSNIREAKDFLVSRIVTEAQREGVPLSEIERKMMYFSETGCSLPDIMDVSDAFDRDYDMAVYEEKIGKLIRNFCTDSRKNNRDDFLSWKEAVRVLRREDHYLIVLIDAKPTPKSNSFIKLVTIGVVLTCVVFGIAYLWDTLFAR